MGQTTSTTPYTYGQHLTPGKKSRPPVGAIIAVIAIVVVVSLLGFLVFRGITGDPTQPATSTEPGGNPTTEVCPKQPLLTERQPHPTGDGRVYGGRLSYPQLKSPWGPEQNGENRVPFGRDVAEQIVVIHENPSNKGGWGAWVASVLVGELYAGDGFYEPKKGSDIVNKCIFGSFYGQEDLVTANTLKSEAFSVDGYEGWYTETNLTFEIANLPTTNEIAIVIIVRTSEMSSSIFFASIPGDAMNLMPDVRQAISGLQVHPN
jgi:hypothetical protein